MPTTIKTASGIVPLGAIVATVRTDDLSGDGWLICDGRGIPSQYQELITLLGSTNTPNLIGRTLIGAGSMAHAQTSQQSDGRDPQLSALGQTLSVCSTGGECLHQLTAAEMPSHSHTINGGNFGYHNRSFDGVSGDNDLPFETDSSIYLGATDPSGSDAPHFNVQPYFAVTYMIYAGG